MYRECTSHVDVVDVGRKRRLRTLWENNVQDVAGLAMAVEAADAAFCRIHHELQYIEKKNMK